MLIHIHCDRCGRGAEFPTLTAADAGGWRYVDELDQWWCPDCAKGATW
jgi:hypothetical protein